MSALDDDDGWMASSLQRMLLLRGPSDDANNERTVALLKGQFNSSSVLATGHSARRRALPAQRTIHHYSIYGLWAAADDDSAAAAAIQRQQRKTILLLSMQSSPLASR